MNMPDMNVAARKANNKLQRLENERAAREGREPRNIRQEMLDNRKALLRA